MAPCAPRTPLAEKFRHIPITYLYIAVKFQLRSDFRFWGKMTPKVQISKMSFRIHRRDTELHFAAKFGENRPLRSCRKVVWITTKNSGSTWFVPAPSFPKMGQSRPKFPERCHPLTCPCIPTLVRVGCVLRTYPGKIDFSAKKKSIQYNSLGFQQFSLQ